MAVTEKLFGRALRGFSRRALRLCGENPWLDLERTNDELRATAAELTALRTEHERISKKEPRPTPVRPSVERSRPIAIDGVDLDDLFHQVRANYAPTAAPFSHYDRLVTALEEHPRVRLLAMHEFAGAEAGPGEVIVGLRHDIDADPETGIRCARRLARTGAPGSFYLLPTARYYGHWEPDQLVRNGRLKRWLRAFIVAGAEIGLHNDAMGVQTSTSLSGDEVMLGEIQWLRSQGAVIRGTVGHNSAPSYGAENSEIFVGRRLWDIAGARKELPIETLSEPDHGLEYEGTFALPHESPDETAIRAFCATHAPEGIRDPEWMRTYMTDNPCCGWGMDAQLWITARDRWTFGGRFDAEPVFQAELDLDKAIERVVTMPGGTRCVVVLHPEYFCLPDRGETHGRATATGTEAARAAPGARAAGHKA